ncbi:hypothetical protein QOZ80_2AG0150980 [Eleusine coracana subsp. coracana]|nr:hypothetical protein QOZ80_2AG0150980 [Eleusine coracana subsp. coracana]
MSSLSPLDSSPPASAEVPLAPGFRFHPTDEELVSYYLRRRIAGRRLRVDAIAEVDLYRLEPWELPSLSRIRSRDAQWYFFARLDRKITGAGAGGRGGPGNRTNRATPQGYWKTTGKDREVFHRGKPVGMKKTLVFHNGRAPKGARTNWVMHEYRLLDAEGPQDLHVVCRIFQKFGSGPQNGAQYGAPYMEEEWEEEDDAIQKGATVGTSAKVAATSGTADEESNEEDENGYSKTNELAQAHEMLNPPEMTALQAQGSNETSEGSYDGGAISLEEILSSTVSAENIIGGPEGQNATDDNFSVADFSGCPTKVDAYVGQDGTMNWSDPANDECTNWPLRVYSNQNPVNGTLSSDEFFGTGNGSNENTSSEQQQISQSDYQNLNLQGDGFVPPRQVDDGMVFYDAPPNWDDGNNELYLSDFLNEPLDNQVLYGDDMMDFFVDAPENDFKFDMLGSVEGSDYQLTEMSNFAQKDNNKDMSTFDGIYKTPAANDQYGASSSGSHEDLYPDKPVDGTAGKAFGKLVNMLGSIPAPPALATTEFPPATGKSVLTGVNPSSIRVTAGIIQLGGLSFTGTEHRPLQKNRDFSLLLSFTMESDVTSKSISFEPATRVGAVPVVMRSGFYLFFVSAMILMLSYKVGSCIYSR